MTRRRGAAQRGLLRFPEASRTATMALDAAWHFTSITPAAAAIFGRTADDLRGQPLHAVIGDIASNPLGQVLQQVHSSREPAVVVVPSLLRPGRHLWARVSPARDGGVRLAIRFLPQRRSRARAQRFGALVLPCLSLWPVWLSA